MEPIAKKKATVSPFNKTTPNDPIEEDTTTNTSSNPISTDVVTIPEPPTPNPNVDDDDEGRTDVLEPREPEINVPSSDPIIRNQGNRSVAPSPPEYVSDVMAVDRRVEALIDYLEQWIKVGNLKMTDIRDYIQNYTA